jgi:hypothetical protein
MNIPYQLQLYSWSAVQPQLFRRITPAGCDRAAAAAADDDDNLNVLLCRPWPIQTPMTQHMHDNFP